MPPDLRRWFRGYEEALRRIEHAFSATDGQLIVPATDAPLLGHDANGLSDIYAWYAPAQQLILVSIGLGGRSGNSASHWPSIDAWAEHIVFQSSADDLTTEDTNSVSDICLYESASGWLRYFTAAAAGNSEHPSLDAAGETLVYDQAIDPGVRAVLWGDPAFDEDTPLTPPADDSHHPAISADGRCLTWLEGSGVIRFRDDEYGLGTSLPCPAELQSRAEHIRPVFVEQSGMVEWVILGEVRSLFTTNPLAK